MSCFFHCRIVRHLQPSLSESAVGNLMHLSALTTLSSRIGHLDSHAPPPPHHRHCGSTHNKELEELWALWNTKLGSQSMRHVAGEPEGDVEGKEGGGRWRAVEDMSAWVTCPIGVCPQQRVSANMLDVPSLHASRGSRNGCRGE